MTLKIEAGKYYRTRDGRKVGPMRDHGTGAGTDRWRASLSAGHETFWNDNGGAHWAGKVSPSDLVAEWADEPETGTLAELNVKPGDVVECVCSDGSFVVGKQYRISTLGGIIDDHGEDWVKRYERNPIGSTFRRIVSRASQSDTTKLWRDMTPEEKGVLLLAHHEGKVIEWTRYPGDTEFRQDSARGGRPVWDDCHAYRVKPEPKPEPKQQTQRIVWTPLGRDGYAFHSGEAEVGDWVLTFETEKTEDGLRPIPITLKFEEHF